MTLNIENLQKERERLVTGGGFRKNLVSMPEGKGVVVVRLLSSPDGGLYQKTRTHNVNGKNLHCPREVGDDGYWRGPCPICEYYNLLWKNSKTKSPEEAAHDIANARAIKPIERVYYNVIVRNELDPDTGESLTNVGPKILSVGKTIHEKIVRAIVGDDEEEKLGDITDPTTGRDFKIVKTLKQGNDAQYPEYSRSKFLEVSPLGNPEEVKKWMENLHDLSELRKVLTYEELLKQLRIHFGLEKDDSINFDATEFIGDAMAKEEATVEVSKTQDAAPQEETPAATDTSPVMEESEQLADDEFMKGLENI